MTGDKGRLEVSAYGYGREVEAFQAYCDSLGGQHHVVDVVC